ncbi:MAG: hypothetical protein LBD29_04605 [Treponema sp.]|jgi:hypothetical protein|nr:hypothetical protein [Treponema sp.]
MFKKLFKSRVNKEDSPNYCEVGMVIDKWKSFSFIAAYGEVNTYDPILHYATGYANTAVAINVDPDMGQVLKIVVLQPKNTYSGESRSNTGHKRTYYKHTHVISDLFGGISIVDFHDCKTWDEALDYIKTYSS